MTMKKLMMAMKKWKWQWWSFWQLLYYFVFFYIYLPVPPLEWVPFWTMGARSCHFWKEKTNNYLIFSGKTVKNWCWVLEVPIIWEMGTHQFKFLMEPLIYYVMNCLIRYWFLTIVLWMCLTATIFTLYENPATQSFPWA